MKDTISSRQTAIIASILVFANKILALPSLLSEYARGDSLFILLLMFMVDIGGLFIFFAIKKRYKKDSFFDILSMNLGKVIAIIIYSLLLGYFFIKILLNFNITHTYFKLQVYHDNRMTIFLFVTLVILSVTIYGGLRSLCRTIEFFYLPIIIGFFFCIFVSFTNFKTPLILFDTSIIDFFTGIYKYLFIFGDFLLLFMIMDKIQYNKKMNSQVLKYVLFSMGVTVVGYFLFFSIFQYTGFMHTNAVSDVIVLSYKLFDIGRLDIVAVITIMLLTFCQLSIYAYVISIIMRNLLPKITTTYSIFLIVIIFVILYFTLLNSFEILLEIVTVWMPYFAILLQYILPLSTLFFLIRKKEKKKV